MQRDTLIGFAACVGITAVAGAWLFGQDPIAGPGRVAQVQSEIARTVENATQSGKAIQERNFKQRVSRATGNNNVPLNIVIDRDQRSGPVPQAGSGPEWVVKSAGLRMRAEPNSRSETLGNYVRGDRFVFIRDENGWALVQSLDDGQKGWMCKKYMREGG